MYGGNSIDLCCCVWVDLSYDGAFLLSYCRTQINIRVRRFLDHSCLYDEILETVESILFDEFKKQPEIKSSNEYGGSDDESIIFSYNFKMHENNVLKFIEAVRIANDAIQI